MAFPVALQRFIIIEIFFTPFGRHGLIQRRHGNINMSFKNKLRHKTVKKRQQQRGNMRAVHIRIGHDNNFVVAKLGNIKVIPVAF